MAVLKRSRKQPEPRKSLWPLIELDMGVVLKRAGIKYKAQIVKVNLHPKHPVELLDKAEDAVYQVWIMDKGAVREGWRLAEQGMLPALLRSLRSFG